RQQRSPVAVVVISSNGEGDRSVESLEVKVPEGWTFQSDPYRGASNLAGRSGSEPVKPRNRPPARNGLRECRECRAGGHSAKANVGIEVSGYRCRTPRGRRGRHVRKGCAVKARNRSRVASALPHSEGIAYKPPCGEIAVCLRDDGPGQNNPDPSEGLWGGRRCIIESTA